ncbi:serine/threonine-protein kinase STY17-like protein [Tanacetum coccineum]
MNSYTFMSLDDVEEGKEISIRKKSFIKRALAYIKIRRQANRVTRNSITKDRAGAHERLVAAFCTNALMYDATRFRKPFRMAHPLFNQIVNVITNHDAYFHKNTDCTRREGISPLIKCNSAIRQLAYGVNANFLDKNMQISERSSRKALNHFCQDVMDIYGPEYLRKPTVTDIEKLYRPHKEKHRFSGIVRIGRGLVVHTPLKCNMLDMIMVRIRSFCWKLLRHKIYRYAPEIPFVANGVTYPSGYYLVDGIYPELAPLVKTIPKPSDDDHKRILYKQKQKSTRKDVEQLFGVL